MEIGRRNWAFPTLKPDLPRKRRVLTFGILALCLTVIISVAAVTKVITVEDGGKKTTYLTIRNNIGEFLDNTELSVYTEDRVVPSRNTKLGKSMTVFLERSVPIVVNLDGQKLVARTLQPNVGEALDIVGNQLGFTLKDSDEVEPGREEPIQANQMIVVRRAVPLLVVADGNERNIEMAPRSIKDALDKLQIALGPLDKVSPGLDEMLTANSKIRVVRVTEKEAVVQVALPYQTVAKPADFPVGFPDRIVAKGSPGLDEQTLKITYEDGVEVGRIILSQRTLQKPVEQIIARGAQTSISRGGQNFSFKRAIEVTASGYCQPGGTTALGVAVSRGVIAVDPKVISFYSHMWIEGYGWGNAVDTGGAIKGNKIDLYFETEQEALNWGVRRVTIYIQ